MWNSTRERNFQLHTYLYKGPFSSIPELGSLGRDALKGRFSNCRMFLPCSFFSLPPRGASMEREGGGGEPLCSLVVSSISCWHPAEAETGGVKGQWKIITTGRGSNKNCAAAASAHKESEAKGFFKKKSGKEKNGQGHRCQEGTESLPHFHLPGQFSGVAEGTTQEGSRPSIIPEFESKSFPSSFFGLFGFLETERS